MNRHSRIFKLGVGVVALICCYASTVSAQTTNPTATVTGSITLAGPQSCTLTPTTSTLTFGNVPIPTTGSGSVQLNPTTNTVTTSGVNAAIGAQVAQLLLTANNVTSAVVTLTPPSGAELSHTDGTSTDVVGYVALWAESGQLATGYTLVAGLSHTETITTSAHTRHFRIGGVASGIDHDDVLGTYSAEIAVSAVCT